MSTNHKIPRILRMMAVAMILAIWASAISPVTPSLNSNSSATKANGNWGIGTLTDAELWALIAQMTLDEKTAMIRGQSDTTCSGVNISPWVQGCVGQAGYMAGVPRLGIPELRLTDGPAGIRLGRVATALPVPGIAATWDRTAAYEYGYVQGSEGRAYNQDVLLAPMINQVAIPTAGRNFETLGEDPYLMAELVAPIVRGVQDQGLIATLKHYAMNDFENGRSSTSVAIDERSLMEMELQAFESGIKAGAGAIMCAYNRVNDVYSCSNDVLLNQILRGIFGFEGWVMSDWGATHRTSDLIYGLDMAMPSGTTSNGWAPSIMQSAVLNGTAEVALTNDFPYVPAYPAEVWAAALDQAIFRILKQMNNAGLLEGTQYGSLSDSTCAPGPQPPCTPYVPPRPDLQALQPTSFAIAQSIAEKSATLLKNEDNILPLSPADFEGNGIVVMGPTAVTPYTVGGGSAHVRAYDPVKSPYEALVELAGPEANIRYVSGYDLDGVLVPSSALTAPDYSNPYPYWTLKPEDEAFSNQPGLLRQQITTASVPSGQQPVLYTGPDAAPDQLDAIIDYTGDNTLPPNTGWRWTGLLTAPSSGSWQLKIFVANQASAQLFVDGLTTAYRRINIGAYPTFPTNSFATLSQTAKSHDLSLPDLQAGTWTVTLTAGQQLHLDLRVITGSTTPTKVQFRWIPPNHQITVINAAVEAASNANKVVIFAYDEGTEGSDRGGNAIANGLKLPGYQDDLIAAVAAANPNTIVVLNTGDPVFMPWVDQVKAILEMWYPGQMGGPATANVLLGYVNPSGKLPVTFPNGASPVGLRFPQDMQNPACAVGTADYGTPASGPGNPNNPVPNPGECPLYPGIYQPGFLWDEATGRLHNYRTIDFTTNGLFVGYRWYDLHDVEPLFPFGHGLSYTQFEYSDLYVQPSGDGYDVSFAVKNIGPVAGAEVAQVYVGPPLNPPVPLAEKALAGFERIELAPGESKQVTVHIGVRQLSYWSVEAHDWVVVGGYRPIYVGSSSRDIRLANWAGFFPPVDNEAINSVKAGSTVPVKFSLYGYYGLEIFNPDNPRLQPIDCQSGEPIGAPIPTRSVPGLLYDPFTEQYIYPWKTEKAWAGTCGRLEVQVDPNTIHTATFRFGK